MDFKGITWAGNIYEKFEAMCLEVEEVMYEDTVKYVENQVQKVGVSVKKFYAEVLQDLVPPSCVDPVNVAAVADINKKPKLIVSDIHGDLINKEAGDVEDLTPSAKHLLPPMSLRVSVGNTQSKECSKKSTRAGASKRSTGIKRISHAMPSVSEDGSGLLFCDIRSNRLVASDDLNVTTSSEFLSAESVKQEKNNCECSCPAPGKDLSGESPRQNTDAIVCNSSCHGFPPAPIVVMSHKDNSREDDASLSQMKSIITDISEVESAGEETISSYEDYFDMEVIETGDILEPVEKSKLEESCILVEFVSQGTKKHKSYKKKMCDAISSKLRSTRKQNLCVSDCEGLSDKTRLHAHNSCDFGWELL